MLMPDFTVYITRGVEPDLSLPGAGGGGRGAVTYSGRGDHKEALAITGSPTPIADNPYLLSSHRLFSSDEK